MILPRKKQFLLSILVAEIDECASNPCSNNGTCVDLLNDFYCNCSAGFNGSHCEIGKWVDYNFIF